ncbi:MAG: TetR/AcrR family transcriptional regulator [Lachnospiraceae bacterium]|nr:TetR/AcrR family transcriptional regulator [Lachnospiraceae bacterium]
MNIDKRRTKTKDKIIELTILEIKNKGYANISIRDITSKLALSPSTFYNHFDSKQSLLDQTLYEVSEIVFRQYTFRFKQDYKGESPIDEVVFFVNEILNQFNVNKNLMDFLFFSPTALISFSKSVKNPAHRILNESYRLLNKLKEFYNLKIDLDTFHIKCWAFFDGYVLLVSSNILVHDTKLLYDMLYSIMDVTK